MKQQEKETSKDLLKGTLLICDLSKLGWKRLYSVVPQEIEWMIRLLHYVQNTVFVSFDQKIFSALNLNKKYKLIKWIY